MDTKQIEVRYDSLADSCCSLSCGGAIDHAKVQSGEVCIDLGSGRGTDVLRMAELTGDSGFAYGVDVTDAMLQKATKSAKKMAVANAKFVKSNLEDIQLDSGLADVIISNCTINHASDKQAVWNEIFRLLKPGGRFAVSDIYSTVEVPEKYKNDPAAVAECWAGSDTKEVYLQTVEKAGFKNIKLVEESKPYPKGDIEVVSITIVGQK